MALDLYMLGLIVEDMGQSLAFYRRLGLDIPEVNEKATHVEIKMGNGLTFFLDSRPSRWDVAYARAPRSGTSDEVNSYTSVLEFYLDTGAAVEAKYAELIAYGYQGQRAPYATTFGMCFAMIKDPDGNTILLSGELPKTT